MKHFILGKEPKSNGMVMEKISGNLICKLFGHKYNHLQLMMMKIELGWNKKAFLNCQRCSQKLYYKDLLKS